MQGSCRRFRLSWMEDKVARQFKHALRDLTFNSKPIINNLTMLAQEQVSHASSIVPVLLSHLLTVLISCLSIISPVSI